MQNHKIQEGKEETSEFFSSSKTEMERTKEKRGEILKTRFSQLSPTSTICQGFVLFIFFEILRTFSLKVQLNDWSPALLGQKIPDSKKKCPILFSQLPFPDFLARGWLLGIGVKGNSAKHKSEASMPKPLEMRKICYLPLCRTKGKSPESPL